MNSDVASLVVVVASVLASVVALAVVYGVVAYSRTHKNDVAFNQLMSWAEIMVRAAEQKFGLDGPRKKELVLLALKTMRDRLGSKLSDSQLDDIIEANVFLMNGGFKILAGELLSTEETEAGENK